MLAQGIGAPSASGLKKGDAVKAGQLLGAYSEEKLGVSVHSPMDGIVAEATEAYVIIEK